MNRCKSGTETIAGTAGVAMRSDTPRSMSVVAEISRSAAWTQTWFMGGCTSRIDGDARTLVVLSDWSVSSVNCAVVSVVS